VHSMFIPSGSVSRRSNPRAVISIPPTRSMACTRPKVSRPAICPTSMCRRAAN
jgi:hypothetical protein